MTYAKGPQKIHELIPELMKMQSDDITPLGDDEVVEQFEDDINQFTIPPHLEVHDIPQEPLLGKGVFLMADEQQIDEREIIGIYAGEYMLLTDEDDFDGNYSFEVLTVKLTEKRRKRLKELGLSVKKSASELVLYVDALHDGNFVRFINNSSNPNVEALIETVHDEPQVIYRCVRTIYPGEQLLVDYTKTYWEPMGIKPLPIESDTFMLSLSGEIQTGCEFYHSKSLLRTYKKHTECTATTYPSKVALATSHQRKLIAKWKKQIEFEPIPSPLMVSKEGVVSLRPGRVMRKGGFIGLRTESNCLSKLPHRKNGSIRSTFCRDGRGNVYELLYAKRSLSAKSLLSLG